MGTKGSLNLTLVTACVLFLSACNKADDKIQATDAQLEKPRPSVHQPTGAPLPLPNGTRHLLIELDKAGVPGWNDPSEKGKDKWKEFRPLRVAINDRGQLEVPLLSATVTTLIRDYPVVVDLSKTNLSELNIGSLFAEDKAKYDIVLNASKGRQFYIDPNRVVYPLKSDGTYTPYDPLSISIDVRYMPAGCSPRVFFRYEGNEDTVLELAPEANDPTVSLTRRSDGTYLLGGQTLIPPPAIALEANPSVNQVSRPIVRAVNSSGTAGVADRHSSPFKLQLTYRGSEPGVVEYRICDLPRQ